jgi:hypothetical protein
MNRAERRFRTQKIAEKRFRQLYCDYHGTPNAWFFSRYDETERVKAKGMCSRRRDSWRCRCDYCLGRVFLKQSISDQNFKEQIEEAEVNFPPANVLDTGSAGPYDWQHEKWDLYVCPWKNYWRNAFHHPKVKLKHNGR